MGWWSVLLLLIGEAAAEGVHVVQPGDTVRRVAAALGVEPMADEIATLNGVGVTQPLVPGMVLELPPGLDPSGGCQPSYVYAQRGPGQVQLPTGETLALAPRLLLPEGSRVCTGEEGTATLRLSLGVDADVWDDVVLMPSTCVTVRASYVVQGRRRSMLALASGGLSVATPASGLSEIAVQTEAGISVGAGGFRVRRGESLTFTEALDREVATLAQGEMVGLDAGFGNRTEDGAAPGAPVPLLPPATVIGPDDGARAVGIDLRWSGDEEAMGYFVTMAVDAGFLEVVHRRWVPGAERYLPELIHLPNSAAGYWWLVTAVDRTGLEGLPSELRKLRSPFEDLTE